MTAQYDDGTHIAVYKIGSIAAPSQLTFSGDYEVFVEPFPPTGLLHDSRPD